MQLIDKVKPEPDRCTGPNISRDSVIGPNFSAITLNEHLDNMKTQTITAPGRGVFEEPVKYLWFHFIGNPRAVIGDRDLNHTLTGFDCINMDLDIPAAIF